MTDAGSPSLLPEESLARWAALDLAAALAEIQADAVEAGAIAAALATVALARADQTPEAALRWVDLAGALANGTATDTLQGELAYARARSLARLGHLPEAEGALRAAQAHWRDAGQPVEAARANLGLTQILAMQGRLEEAEDAAQRAVVTLQDAQAADVLVARAWRNLGTLQTMREQHRRALASFANARALVDAAGDGPDMQMELAHILLNEASAYTFLDEVDAAEAALRAALQAFGATDDAVNRGRTRTNFGRLLVRTGRLAPAIAEFEQAARELLGSELGIEAEDDDELRVADELLLEWALGYLALNLFSEAGRLLARAESLFRRSGQPYELAQTLYTRAALARAQGDVDAAQTACTEALSLLAELDNPYWTNRTRLIQAQLQLAQGDAGAALATVDALPTDAATGEGPAWDVAARVQAALIQVDAFLALQSVDRAAAVLDDLRSALPESGGTELGGPELGGSESGGTELGGTEFDMLPAPLALSLVYARGRIAQAAGDSVAARGLFEDAVARLEQQRATLTLEQFRTAYLLDKDALFADLILSLLAQPAPSAATLSAVFDTIERLRSRVLLEQMLAITGAAEPDGDADAQPTEESAQRDELRRRLNWLYNRLLGEEGSRRRFVELSAELQRTEAQLVRLELRRAPSLPLAEPLSLADLQHRLEVEQVVVIYYVAGEEVMALVVNHTGSELWRKLASVPQVRDAVDEFQFQLGRMEVRGGSPERLRRMGVEMRAVLERLYALLVQPFAAALDGRRVTWIPFGLLHQVPFHALWRGDGYLLEHMTCTYAPSATMAARRWDGGAVTDMRTLAAVAVDDPTIPAARAEAEIVARAFPHAELFVADAAGLAGLRRAAATADVLHIATHGLFRQDNPFFSALKLADGWIDVHELYRLPLAARLVVLSACESGAGQATGGDELIGLARGFLAAGAETLVVSRWNVHDAMGAQLMTRFHGHLRRGPAASTTAQTATALRAAQIEAIRAGEHPYYWASFQVVG